VRATAWEEADRCFEVAEPTIYCTVADRHVFPGVVALLNSLRLTGHREPLFVLDAGLTTDQRRVVEQRCTVAQTPIRARAHPALLKPFVRRLGIAGTLVFLDSDIIVTGSLAEIVEPASRGAICAFPDPDRDRYFDEWGEIFDLRAELRHQTYVSSHLVAFSTAHWPSLLARWEQACACILDREVLAEKTRNSPVHLADQDALNAVLMSEIPDQALRLLRTEIRAQGALEARTTRVLDLNWLRCRRAGHEQVILHIGGGGKSVAKPWQPAARPRVRRDAYTRCLRRLLNGRDIELHYPANATLPFWLVEGELGALYLFALGTLHALQALPAALVRRRFGRRRPSDAR
jgi:hypothetical protein